MLRVAELATDPSQPLDVLAEFLDIPVGQAASGLLCLLVAVLQELIALTNEPESARAFIGENLAMYGTLPSYRAMLDKEGAAGPADIAMVGDEAALDAQLDRLRDVGVTDFDAAIVPVDDETDARTIDYLQSKL